MTNDDSQSEGATTGDADAPPDDRTPETDLLDRYERMVQTQVETVNGIDEKAATTMRLVALLLGALLSLFTFLIEDYSPEVTVETALPLLWIASGIGSLLASLALCLYTYLSSRMLFGPKAILGEILAEHRVGWTDYESKVLNGYATAITINREVIRKNSRRFRNTLLTLIYGLVGLSFGLGLFIAGFPLWTDIVVSFGAVVIMAIFTAFILVERYMVVPHED